MEALVLHVRPGLLDPRPSHLIRSLRARAIEVRCGKCGEKVDQPSLECRDVRSGWANRIPLGTYVRQ